MRTGVGPASVILCWLALALPSPSTKLGILGELTQDLQIHTRRVLIQYLDAPGRNLRNAAGRTVEQGRLRQVGNCPRHTIGEHWLFSARQKDLPVICCDLQ